MSEPTSIYKMTKSTTEMEIVGDGLTLKVTGLDGDPVTKAMMALILAYDALEDWVQERVDPTTTLPEAVAEARRQLKLKTRHISG